MEMNNFRGDKHDVAKTKTLVQIITSGIGNHPPGDGVVKYLSSIVKPKRVVASDGTGHLQETVADMFKAEKRANYTKCSKFLNRMNVCELGATTAANGVVELNFSYAILNEAQDGLCAVVGAKIPPLLPSSMAAQADAYELDDINPSSSKGCGIFQLCFPS